MHTVTAILRTHPKEQAHQPATDVDLLAHCQLESPLLGAAACCLLHLCWTASRYERAQGPQPAAHRFAHVGILVYTVHAGIANTDMEAV